MCLPLDKIKFCTCNNDVTKLDNYWILYRKNRSKNKLIFKIGEVISRNDRMRFINMGVIEDRLSEPDAFDVELSFKNKDVLSLVLNNNAENEEDALIYDFEYIKGKWNGLDRSPFDIEENFKELVNGEIKI
jgi:hypothetical protein